MTKNLNTHLLKAQRPLRFFIIRPTNQTSFTSYPVGTPPGLLEFLWLVVPTKATHSCRLVLDIQG